MYEENKELTQKEFAKKIKIAESTLSAILKNGDKYLTVENKQAKTIHSTKKTEKIENGLFTWFSLKRSQNFLITDKLLSRIPLKISEKLNINNFLASQGWIYSFKRRFNINSRKLVGQSGYVKEEAITNFSEKFEDKLAKYHPKDIFNCDESGFVYKYTGNRSFMCRDDENTSLLDHKDRFTILCCASMVGEKRNIMLIGRSKKPNFFSRQRRINSKFRCFIHQFEEGMNDSNEFPRLANVSQR